MGTTGEHRSHNDPPRPHKQHPHTPRPQPPGGHKPGTDKAETEDRPRRPRRRRTSRRPAASTSLETAAQAFRMLTAGPSPLSLDGTTVGHGLPRREIPLDELRAILLHPATSRTTRDAAWRHIIQAAHTGTPAWVIGAVGVALPALWKMAGDLAEGYRGEVADLHAAMLTGFVAALHRIDTGRPGISTRLRWATYRAGLLTRYTREGIPSMPLPPLESAPPPYPWAHPDLLLADAVAKGVLSPLQAELIGRSRLEEVTLKEAAAELGVSYQAAKKARQRGEARLVAAIASGDVEKRLSPPAPKSGLFSVREPNPQPAPHTESAPAGGADPRPAGVRGRSTESDGTPDSEHPRPGGGAFCGPARQPPPPSQASPSSQRGRAQSRRRSGNRRRRPGQTGGTP